MRKGLFISFEGNDGSGKTTVSRGVVANLIAAGYDCLYTREPGGSVLSERIRDLLLDPENTMDDRTEALLYAAARREHLCATILPALAEGKIVICDRFVDSSLAYQGIGRQLGIEEIWAINAFAIENHLPDKTFFLRIDEQVALKRAIDRSTPDRLEQEDGSFHTRVARGYAQIIARDPQRIEVIDADKPADQLIRELGERIRSLC